MARKRSVLEWFLYVLSFVILIGGIAVGILYANSNSILESGADMCSAQAFFALILFLGVGVVGWAVLLEIVKIADRLHQIENKMNEY